MKFAANTTLLKASLQSYTTYLPHKHQEGLKLTRALSWFLQIHFAMKFDLVDTIFSLI